METLDHLICAYDEQYIKQEIIDNMREHYTQCLKLINGYIVYLRKAKSTNE